MEFSTLIQPGHTWIDVVLSLILMMPGIIAALSSLRNGKHIKELHDSGRVDKPLKKKERGPNGIVDWYKPPDV